MVKKPEVREHSNIITPETSISGVSDQEKIRDEKARQFIEEINTLKQTAQTKEDYQKLIKLYQDLEKLYEVKESQELEPWLAEQYENQRRVLSDCGLVKTLESGDLGFKGIDGQEYPMPTEEELAQLIEENRELVEKKKEQGFTKLLVVPFGMKLDDLLKSYGGRIIHHFKAGNLKDSQGNKIKDLRKTKKDDDPKNDAAQDNEYYPLWKWEKYTNADVSGELVYYPEELSQQNHQGKTKQDVITQQGGWNILLIEDTPNIPRDNPKEKGGRIQLDTKGASIKKYIEQGKEYPSPKEYKKALKDDPMYQGESGMTPEDDIICSLTRLEETGQVNGDYTGGEDAVSYQIEALFPSSGYVPDACWSRGGRQAGVGGCDTDYRSDNCGVRPAVRLKKS